MIREYFYLKVKFDYYTEEHEEVMLGICEKMGMVINRLTRDRSYVIITEDEKIIDYIKHLAECDIISILREEEEE